MNSSIFNFDVLAGILSAPAKTKAWFLFLGIGALACAYFASATLNRWIPEGEKAQHRAAPPGTRVLLLGNSQFLDVKIAGKGQAFFNAALAGSDYAMQEAVFYAQLDNAPGIQILLLGFDNIPLRVTGMADRKGDYTDLLECGVPWYALPDIPLAAQVELSVSYTPLLRPILVGPKPDLEILSGSFFKGTQASPKPLNVVRHPFDPNRVIPPFKSPPSGGDKKMNYYMKHLSNEDALAKNRSAFLRIMAACRDRHIKVVLLRSPCTAEFINNRSRAWDEELDALYQNAQALYGGGPIPLWDEDNNAGFPIHLFNDPNHLNPEGAKRYSATLAQKIDSVLKN